MANSTGVSKDILMMDARDNIAVCLRDLRVGESVWLESGIGLVDIRVLDIIPRGHKICIRAIQKAGHVLKYGEVIGKASTDIHIGQHVHVHNVVD